MTGEENFERSKNLLGSSAMTVGALIEVIGSKIYKPEIWKEKHSILEEEAFYQESINFFSELDEEKQEIVKKMVAKRLR